MKWVDYFPNSWFRGDQVLFFRQIYVAFGIKCLFAVADFLIKLGFQSFPLQPCWSASWSLGFPANDGRWSALWAFLVDPFCGLCDSWPIWSRSLRYWVSKPKQEASRLVTIRFSLFRVFFPVLFPDVRIRFRTGVVPILHFIYGGGFVDDLICLPGFFS